MKKSNGIIFFFLLLTLAFFSCKTIKRSFDSDEAKHSKDPLEVWFFSGRFAEEKQKQDFGFTYLLIHSYDKSNDKESFSAYLTILDFKLKKSISEVAYTTFSPDSIVDALPMKFQLINENEIWNVLGKEGFFKLNAKMCGHPENRIRLRIKKNSLRFNMPDSITQFSDGANFFIYPNVNVSGKIKINTEKLKGITSSNYLRIWNASNFINKEKRVGQIIIKKVIPNETLIITMKLFENGDIKNKIGFTINEKTNKISTLSSFSISPTDYWFSKYSGKKYPLSFKIRFLDNDQELIIKPEFNEQELTILKSAIWIGYGKLFKNNIESDNQGTVLMLIN